MRGIGIAMIALALVATPRAEADCAGDCGGDGMVTVSELITGVNIALGSAAPTQCSSVDVDGNGQVAVNELVTAVTNALSGCPSTGQFTGQYTARVDVGDGETALIRLQVAADGSATGTLSVGPAASQGRAALRLDIPLLDLVGTVDLDSGAYHLTGTAAGNVPVDVSGILPERPGPSGTVDLEIGDESFPDGTIVAGSGNPTPTRPPVTPTATFTPTSMPAGYPTPPGSGCSDSRGSWSLTFRNVSGTNAYADLGPGLGLNKGSFTVVANLAFGGGAVACSYNPGDIIRRVQLTYIGGGATQGASIPLGRGRGQATFDYLEMPSSNPLGTRGWRSDSGTVVIDQLDGSTVRFHIVGAVMSPEPSFSFQTPAAGTMTIDAGAAGTLSGP